ncbi:hypothetical protein [Natrialba asiatica]|uniref:Uncharacterized protein n=1 Tax=Natrialba asiatica (strain ATCC 700177 / DSM 12278 / JCM 9576 / FERM P-10747 / NBRC 102637 / 172P1) TaxID=29540 RepID=M0APX2_NATA1|nr:hypothetical protein [Natrialba asiatica]ELZ00776.1 hypothetical protein C481_11095 [Natrialba asiatica DSM 12278]
MTTKDLTYVLYTREPHEQFAPPKTYGVKLARDPHSCDELWALDSEIDLEDYNAEKLTEGEAVVEGFRMEPGTLLPDVVDDIQSQIQEGYGIDIKEVSVDDTTLYDYIKNRTTSLPAGHQRYIQPFDYESI